MPARIAARFSKRSNLHTAAYLLERGGHVALSLETFSSKMHRDEEIDLVTSLLLNRGSEEDVYIYARSVTCLCRQQKFQRPV